MKGFFWNSDGIRDTAKHCTVYENVREEKLDLLSYRRQGDPTFQLLFLSAYRE